MPNYLISPGSDSDRLSLQIFFGFKDEVSRLEYFKKIFIYNTCGFRVSFKKLKLSSKIINFYQYVTFKDILLSSYRFFAYYLSKFCVLKITFIETLFFYVAYKKIIAENNGVIFKVFEFNDYDFIFHSLVKDSTIKVVYFLHTMKPLFGADEIFLKELSKRENNFFIAPSNYHLRKLENYVKPDNLFLSNYNSGMRIPREKDVLYDKSSPYLVLLNGDETDELLIQVATQNFGFDIILRPHPTRLPVSELPTQSSNMNRFKGIIYNRSSAILRLEWIELPKFFISISSEDTDILHELRMESNDLHAGVVGRDYIIQSFHCLEDDESFWEGMNENFNIE